MEALGAGAEFAFGVPDLMRELGLGLCSKALSRTWIVQNYEKASVRPLKYLLLSSFLVHLACRVPVCLVAGCKPTCQPPTREGCALNVGMRHDCSCEQHFEF